MILKTLQLKNFRCYEDLTVKLHPQLTVLVANNGGGKTSVLNAIAIALADYVKGLPLSDATIPMLHERDRRRIVVNRELLTTEATESTVIMLFCSENSEPSFAAMKVIGNTFDPNKLLYYDGEVLVPKSVMSKIAKKYNDSAIADGSEPLFDLFDIAMSDYGKGIIKDNTFNLPIISCYGVRRDWHDVNLSLDDSMKSSDLLSRFTPYKDALQFRKDYKTFFHWFEYVAKIHADERNALFERFAEKAIGMPTQYGELIKAIRLSIDLCLHEVEWRNITYSHKHQDIMMEHPVYGAMELNRLSDGIRNIIALTGDIALRCVRLNKHLGIRACEETTGVVLIDEVDMHLHPSWQQTVLGSLTKAFPRIQFIVTTHSPQVLSTVHRENIRLLGTNEAGQMTVSEPLADSYGEPSNDVLQAIMHVDPQPPVPEKADLERLTELVDQGLSDDAEAQRLLAELKQSLSPHHPQLEKVERSIRRQRALGR